MFAMMAMSSSIITTGCSLANKHSSIETVLQIQAEAWNRGDIDAFMEHYWKSEKLTFSSGGETIHGWQATYNRYKSRYPNRAAMGELTFSDLDISELGKASAMVLGRWHIKRQNTTPANPDNAPTAHDDAPVAHDNAPANLSDLGGNFSLVLRRFGHNWKIIHDHTSVSPPVQSP